MSDHDLENAIRRALRGTPGTFDTDAAWQRLEGRVTRTGAVPRGARLRLAAMLAAALIIIAAGITMSRAAAGRRIAPILEVATGGGERRTVTLSDGSTVALTPHTTLRFRREAGNRVAQLSGQATFTVAHDATHPFIVRFANAQAVDVGTQFVVRSFSGDSVSVVAVVSGEVALRAGAAEMRLTAGQAAQVTAPGTVARADARWVLAWSDGRMMFDDKPLGEVARELARWFDAGIRIADPAVAQRRVTAVYNAPTLTGVLDALALATGSRYTRAGSVVTFTAADGKR